MQVLAGVLVDTQGMGNLCHDQRLVGERRERDEADAVLVAVDDLHRRGQGQACLPGPAWPRQGQAPDFGVPQQLDDVPRFRLAPDQRRRLDRQVGRSGAKRPQRRKLVGQSFGPELEEALRVRQVLQSVFAQIDPGKAGHVVDEQAVGGLRDPGPGRRARQHKDPRRPMDPDADVANARAGRFRGVDPHPDTRPGPHPASDDPRVPAGHRWPRRPRLAVARTQRRRRRPACRPRGRRGRRSRRA